LVLTLIKNTLDLSPFVTILFCW